MAAVVSLIRVVGFAVNFCGALLLTAAASISLAQLKL